VATLLGGTAINAEGRYSSKKASKNADLGGGQATPHKEYQDQKRAPKKGEGKLSQEPKR